MDTLGVPQRSQLLAQALASMGQTAPAVQPAIPQFDPKTMAATKKTWGDNAMENALRASDATTGAGPSSYATLPTGPFSQLGAGFNSLGQKLGGLFHLGAGS